MLQQVFISLAWTQLDFLAPLNGLLSFTGRLRCDETLPSPNWTMAGIQFDLSLRECGTRTLGARSLFQKNVCFFNHY